MTRLTESEDLCSILDRELIGFLTAVSAAGQPQTSPVWFVRDVDDIVVYNRAGTPRLRAISSNPKVAFNLRGDLRASAAVTFEGVAVVEDLPPAMEFPGYLDKYAREIERLGWTPQSFSSDYGVGLRVTVTRLRSWGLSKLMS
ncbi:MAG: pyridoxamine 5'-phosphate oxidase family protein [Acidimicrobiia bacterium]|jgi:PPOX class probable F420-dependent enzyme